MRNRKFGLATFLLLAALSACGGGAGKESSGEYFDDSVITTKVKAAFVQSKEVKATSIEVTTYKGTVQLSGFADSRAEIDKAGQIAAKVGGVKAVRNDLRLKTP